MVPRSVDHILMTADTVGGVWTYAIELTRGLANYGVHVSLATMGGHLSKEQRADALSLPNLEVFESNYKLEWMQNPWDDVRMSSEWLLRLEQRLHPDIVHLNTYAHGAIPWTAPHLVVAHSCVLSWWRAVLGENCDSNWNRYKRAVASGLRSARIVIAPSAAMLQSIYVHYSPIPAGRVIPNGRSAELFSPAKKDRSILTAGRLWDKAKNVQLLDKVAPRIPWPIRVAGDQRQPGTQQSSTFRALEILGRLSLERLSIEYGRAGIYVAPAKYEPFGLSILEAALSACPLVLGNIPSLRELWNDAALFVDPDDPDELRQALLELIQSPWIRQELAQRARRRALQYSLKRMAEGYMEVYRTLLRSGVRLNRRNLRLAVRRSL